LLSITLSLLGIPQVYLDIYLRPAKDFLLQQYLTANSDRLSHFGRRMSLFLQTLVLRGILFREQEHRQERIGVRMTLWPTGPTK
jgi:hypothetical protein